MTLPELTSVPGGTIELSDARRGTSRDVALFAFEIGRVPVTQAQYAAVLGRADPPAAGAAAPAHGVRWVDAVAWCNAASSRAGLRPAYDVRGGTVR
ncbi:hypothetical protein Cpa01nite_03160 [Cellulomonas pakistanensis]|uniref:Sulfatase-modifying factor enzyme-like domain-containing protein n=1 Tax=Cellulomonas pakistanensis TaxID=992287 RepID=A0A919P632_9CELL|nr:hypothetical protein Cpa01nite_03160 [Cellulomonas pakistanensis]